LNAAGTALIYSTYLGGNGTDGASAIAVDAAGDAFVAGQALSTDFPVTQGAFQIENNGANTSATNAFVARLNSSGTELLYSTYLGGSGTSCMGGNAAVGYDGDVSVALAVDSSGDAYLAGVTFSKDFPVTKGALQTSNAFNYKGDAGPTAFVTKLNPSGSALLYSTYLGGSGGFINITPFFAQFGGDEASGLAVDSFGDAYVTGATASLDFPVTAGAFQSANAGATGSGGSIYNAFVAELNPAGGALLYSTYLGGNGSNPNVESSEHLIPIGDLANGLALDGSGNVYIAGQAESANFPVTTGAFQTTIPAATSAFIAKLGLGAAGSGFTIAGTEVTVTAGATSGNTSVITVTPVGGFTGAVILTAAITSHHIPTQRRSEPAHAELWLDKPCEHYRRRSGYCKADHRHQRRGWVRRDDVERSPRAVVRSWRRNPGGVDAVGRAPSPPLAGIDWLDAAARWPGLRRIGLWWQSRYSCLLGNHPGHNIGNLRHYGNGHVRGHHGFGYGDPQCAIKQTIPSAAVLSGCDSLAPS